MNNKELILHVEKKEPVLERYTLDLGFLYPDVEERKLFESRWEKFYLSDKTNDGVLFKEKDKLTYISERMIPTKIDSRPPLLLMFGNPAPSSIKLGMIFSYEGNGREHRIWRIFRNIGLLNFDTDQTTVNQTRDQLNSTRRQQLLDLDYVSAFRIGLIPFISFPSTPSKEPWTGVAGVRKLFGSRTFKLLELAERSKHIQIMKEFMPRGGNVLIFQKDAFNNLKAEDSPLYSRQEAVNGNLVNYPEYASDIRVIGMPPTRALNGTQNQLKLKNLLDSFKS